MKRYYLAGIIFCLAFASFANATLIWNFASDPKQVANGTTYAASGGTGTITVYGAQVNDSTNNLVGTPVQDGGYYWNGHYYNGTTTLNGLFSTDTKFYNLGSGIAPFDPAEGGSPSNGYPDQLGINDDVSHNYPNSGSYGNILELQLGADIPMGTKLSFLFQGPTNDPITGETTKVEFYYKDGSPLMNPSSMTLLGLFGNITTGGTTPQIVNFVKDTNGAETIAVEADCHYLLLDTITGQTPGVPEPRFYGALLAAMLALAGIFLRNRRAVPQAE